jgi:hypothetical protein
MSNFIQNIQINNLTRQLNGLSTTVANLQVGGAPLIAGDIDMNQHSITELNSIQFNNNTTLEPSGANLEYDGEVVVLANTLADYQQNPSASDLDMNNKNIINVKNNINFNNSGVLGNFSFNNYVFEIDRDFNVDGNSLRNVGGIYTNSIFLADGPTNYQQFFHYNEGFYTIATGGNDTRAYINVQTDAAGRTLGKYNTNFLNTPITNLTSLTFQNQNTNAQQTLTINSSDNSLVYNSNTVITAANISQYEISNVVISSDVDYENNSITNLNSIEFSTSDVLLVASDNLEYNNSIVITEANIDGYLPTIPDNELVSSDGVIYTADLSNQLCSRQRTIINNSVLLASDGELSSNFGETATFGSLQNVGPINWSNFSGDFTLSFAIAGFLETPFNNQIEFNVGVRILTADGTPYFNSDGFGFKVAYSDMTQNFDSNTDRNLVTYAATITHNDFGTPLVADYSGNFQVILAFENTNPVEIPILVIVDMDSTLDITAASQNYDPLSLDDGQLNLNSVILQNSDGALLWNGDEIITEATFQSQFNPMTTALNMNTNNITNAGTIRCSAVNPDSINFGGDASKKLAYFSGALQWQNNDVMIDDGSTTYLTTSNTTTKPTSLLDIIVGANTFYTMTYSAAATTLFKGTLLGSGFGLDFVAAVRYDGTTFTTLESPSVQILFDVAENGGAGEPLGIAGAGISGDPTITIGTSGSTLNLVLNCVAINGALEADKLRVKLDVLSNV